MKKRERSSISASVAQEEHGKPPQATLQVGELSSSIQTARQPSITDIYGKERRMRVIAHRHRTCAYCPRSNVTGGN